MIFNWPFSCGGGRLEIIGSFNFPVGPLDKESKRLSTYKNALQLQ